jgi:hypothetical protein
MAWWHTLDLVGGNSNGTRDGHGSQGLPITAGRYFYDRFYVVTLSVGCGVTGGFLVIGFMSSSSLHMAGYVLSPRRYPTLQAIHFYDRFYVVAPFVTGELADQFYDGFYVVAPFVTGELGPRSYPSQQAA